MQKSKLTLALLSLMAASGAANAAYTIETERGEKLTFNARFEARYDDSAHGGEGDWDSGSSRFGLKGEKALDNGWTGLAHAEWGFNSGNAGNNIFERLLYAGVKHDTYGQITAGTKQWSSFYDVAWYTDLGRTFGSRANGVYNFNDWGMDTGSGRATNSVVYRNKFNDFSYGFTYQTKRLGAKLAGSSTADFSSGIGASVTYKGFKNINLGLAFHQNSFDNATNLINKETDGTSSAILLGMNYSKDAVYFGLTAHSGTNWDAASTTKHTEEADCNCETEYTKAVLLDTVGAEIYTHYHFDNQVRLTLTYNYFVGEAAGDLHVDRPTNDYLRHTVAPGFEYHFVKNDLLFWAEYEINMNEAIYDSTANAFVEEDNRFRAGIRYNF